MYKIANLQANTQGTNYLALFLNDPGVNEIGDEALNYTRQPVTFGEYKFDSNSVYVLNDIDVIFPGRPGGYGSITHVALMSTLTGGMIIYFESLGEVIRSKDDKPLEFFAGSIKASE